MVVRSIGVVYFFVPFLRMFLIYKHKGRSGKVCRFGFSVKKIRYSVYSRFRQIRMAASTSSKFWWIGYDLKHSKPNIGKIFSTIPGYRISPGDDINILPEIGYVG